MNTDTYPDMSQNGMNRRAATWVAHRIADEPDGDWAWMYNLIKAALDKAVEASLSREKVLREALEFYASNGNWICTTSFQVGDGISLDDLERNSPITKRELVGGKHARAALASTETENRYGSPD